MKKIYMSPQMDVIELKKQTLLAGSLPMGNVDVDPSEADSPEYVGPEFGEWSF